PDAVPRERRLGAAPEAKRLRLDLPLRRTGQRVRCPEGAVLPLSLRRAAPAWTRPLMCGGRSPGRPPGDRRLDSGHRSPQGPARERGYPDRPAPGLRRAPDEVARTAAPSDSRVPDLRDES